MGLLIAKKKVKSKKKCISNEIELNAVKDRSIERIFTFLIPFKLLIEIKINKEINFFSYIIS